MRKTDEGVFESGYTDAAGEVTLQLAPAPNNVGALEVTVTGHDYRPHEGTSDVIAPDGPWLVHRSHAVDDSVGGDGDAKANPGEDFTLEVTVENVGSDPGSGLAGVLTTTTPSLCEVLDADAGYPDLAPSQQGTSLPDHYRVRVGADAPDGAALGFEIAWSASDGSTGTTSFGETVYQIDFAVDGTTIDDSAEGNGNGVAGPGETVDMTLTLANVGHRDARGISGVLETSSPYVTLIDTEATFPDLAGGATGDGAPPFRFSVASDAPDQQPVSFTLAVTESATGFTETLSFDVLISSCATTAATDVGQAISDNSTAESPFDYGNAIEIGELNVYVDIAHTYIGDLQVKLVSPAGTECLLHDRSGGSTNNLQTWYDTNTAPAEPLSIFNGENAFGEWKLVVSDHAGGDTGSITGWKLEVCGDAVPTTPRIVIVGDSVDDAGACQEDGVADVGETVRYSVEVENTGSQAATAISARLSSNAKVAVLNNPVAIPDLAPGATGVAEFEVLIGAVGCEETAQYTVNFTAAEGEWSDAFTDVLEQDSSTRLDDEDLEGGTEPTGWSHGATSGTDQWTVANTKNHTAGGSYAWFSPNPATSSDTWLVSDTQTIGATATLEFWHFVDLEGGYDGGVLELSANGGTSWVDLGDKITTGGYDRAMNSSSPIDGEAWTGEPDVWRRVVVNLSDWSGQDVRVRWRLATDSSTNRDGWWIDDVTFQSTDTACDAAACGVPGESRHLMVTKQGTDALLEWWADPVCVEFRILRSGDATNADAFSDVTSEDGDATDNQFRDSSGGTLRYWLIQGKGPDGDGPWGHYGR